MTDETLREVGLRLSWLASAAWTKDEKKAYDEARRIVDEALTAARAAAERSDGDRWRPPAGWKLVPEEPTEEMLSAGSDAGGFDGYRQEQNTSDIWEAMLAAAPSPPSAPTPEGGR